VDIKGQQPSTHVNPLRHKGIIGSRRKGEAISLPGNDFDPGWPERLAGMLGICPGPAVDLVTSGGVWNPDYR
jgi:hypothetical protein